MIFTLLIGIKWIKGDDDCGFSTFKADGSTPDLFLTAKSSSELTLKQIEIESDNNNDVLSFKNFPFENEEVVDKRQSLSPESK